jgi:hypothetical protein
MSEQMTVTTTFGRLNVETLKRFRGATCALVLALLAFLLATAWPVAAQGPTPGLPPATWATPTGGAQALPGGIDWTLIGIIAVIVVIIVVFLLLIFLFLLAGRRKPAPAAQPRGYPPAAPPEPAYRPAPPPTTGRGDYQETVAGARAMASLTVQAGPGAGQRFTLSKPETIIGRHPGNDVVIEHQEVSRRHASITREGGGFVLRDLGSNNGTFVNGRRLSGPQALRNGDVIALGEAAQLVFQG